MSGIQVKISYKDDDPQSSRKSLVSGQCAQPNKCIRCKEQPDAKAMTRAPVFISTDRIPPKARLSFWQTQVANLLTHMECSSSAGEGFSGSITAHLSSPTNLIEISAASHAIARVEPKTSHKGEEQIYVCLQLSGEATVEQNNRLSILRAGDMTLLDTSKTFSAEFPYAMSQLVLEIPRALVRRQIGAFERLTATVAGTDTAMGAMTKSFLESLAQNFEGLGYGVAQRLTEQAMDMAVMTLMSSADETPASLRENTATRSVLAYRGRAFIEANLRSHSLAPLGVAEHLGISKRYLSSIFASDGQSVERYIWERRLTKCARDLKDRQQTARSIGEIAFSWGFNNLAHFSQSFKSAFGKTPREFRKHARQ
ncbi:helix-turn-helix domain-containing protein [Paraburkholderia sp. DHOC27]|nr:helix-turn-helix domain-containing protein [Paraburkholderia sp. DHOC27]